GNAATRVVEELDRLLLAGRLDEIEAIFRPDVVIDDRRPGVGNRTVGAAENIENLRIIAGLGLSRIDTRAVAVRGDRLALVVTQWGASWDATDVMAVVVVDAAG